MAHFPARLAAFVLLGFLAVFGAGCGNGGETPADGTPTTPTTIADQAGQDAGQPGSSVIPEGPDVTGVVGMGKEYPDSPYLLDPSDNYYLGMSLTLGDPIVRSRDGEPMSIPQMNEGDQVAVWLSGSCAESFPVQCGVEIIEITSPALTGY